MTNKNSLFTRFFILIVAALMAALPTMQASAALVKCRTDPIFWLSNGDKLVVVLEVNADETDIEEFNYVLHVPAGVTVEKVVYTHKSSDIIESYQVVQDSTPNTYHSDVLVTLSNTNSNPVDVVADASIKSKHATNWTFDNLKNLPSN